MSDDDDTQPRDLDEVLRLETALAEQMLASEISGGSMSPERLKALIAGAQFLQEQDVPWPAAVHEALDRIREQMDVAKSEPDGENA
jgi:hypothetical protein